MAFVEIPIMRGGNRRGSETVTVAWGSLSGSKGALGLRIGIGGGVPHGWKPGQQVVVAYCGDTNRLRIAPAAKGRRINFAGKFASIKVPLVHVTLAEPRPVQSVPHAVENGALILRLPDWAWERGKQLAAEAAARARGRIAA